MCCWPRRRESLIWKQEAGTKFQPNDLHPRPAHIYFPNSTIINSGRLQNYTRALCAQPEHFFSLLCPGRSRFIFCMRNPGRGMHTHKMHATDVARWADCCGGRVLMIASDGRAGVAHKPFYVQLQPIPPPQRTFFALWLCAWRKVQVFHRKTRLFWYTERERMQQHLQPGAHTQKGWSENASGGNHRNGTV